MWLDLSRIIETPGASVPFDTELDAALLASDAILSFPVPPSARGQVVNTAGLLDLHARIRGRMRCRCDRCGTEFERELDQTVDLPLAADLPEDTDSDLFPVENNGIDAAALLETCLLLDREMKTLCRPDCRGLCPRCGKNLNDGPCGCQPKRDPRFAVLEQLLDR